MQLSLPQTSKTMSFLLSLTFSLEQNQRSSWQNRLCLEVERGLEVAQIMCTQISKHKNNKINERKNIIKTVV
jgi:hypothetical protein